MIPGATVAAKNIATGDLRSRLERLRRLRDPRHRGRHLLRHRHASGFKTAVVNDVRIVTGTPASIKAVARDRRAERNRRSQLARRAGAEPVGAVTSTLVAEQLNEVPLSSRNALYALNMLPGVQYGSGGGPRAAGINGLPNNTINITIDGVQTGNMLQSTDGFFSMVTPRLDAVEEITVTGAVPGSGAGPGSVQIQFADALGHQPLRRQRLSLLAPARVQLELLLQQGQQPAEERRGRAPVRLPPGRPDRDPRALRRPQQGVLLLQLRATLPAVERDAHAAAAAPRSAERHLRLQRHVAACSSGATSTSSRWRGPTARSRASTRPSAAARRRSAPATITTGTINDTGNGNTLDYVFQAESVGNQYAPTAPRRLQPLGQAPAERLVLVAALHQHPRPAEQRRRAVPRPANYRHPELLPHDRQRDAALDALRQPRQRSARRLAVVAERLLLEHHG